MQRVVLLHGLAGHPIVFRLMSRRLRADGFSPDAWRYPSLRYGIPELANRIGPMLDKVDQDFSSWSLVLHSMSNIIVRQWLDNDRSSKPRWVNCRRIVMIAPPHLGSHRVGNLAKYLGAFVPALSQLATSPDGLCRSLSDRIWAEYEIGLVVAGRDFVVQPESAMHGSYSDSVRIDALHSAVLWDKATIECVSRFLQVGRFHPTESAS